jgi:Tol biopolymer transport system component
MSPIDDGRIDALIRRLDVPAAPPAEFVQASFRVVASVAANERRRERTMSGRLAGWLGTARWSPPTRRLVTLGVVAVLTLALLVGAVAFVGSRLSTPAPTPSTSRWQPGHIVFLREDRAAAAYSVIVQAIDGSSSHVLFAAPHDATSVSPDGTLIASATIVGQRVFPTIGRSDGGQARLIDPDQTLNLGASAWSHDDKWLAFEAWDDSNHDRDGVYLMTPSGGQLHRLTSKGVPGGFSPDDSQVAIARPEGVFVVGVDGTGERQVGTLQPDGSPVFTPDGRSICVAAVGSVWLVDLATGAQTELPIPGGRAKDVRLSPDGLKALITFEPTLGTTTAIASIGVDGVGGVRILADVADLGEVYGSWLP